MTKKIAILIAVVSLAVVAFGVGCGKQEVTNVLATETVQPQEQEPAVEPVVIPEPEPEPEQDQEVVPVLEEDGQSYHVIKVEVNDYGWDPAVINVKTGETVTIEITNTGKMPHGIFVPQLGINEGVRSRKTIQVDITAPDEPVELPIMCSDPMCGTMIQHNGMVASLVVTN